MTIKELKSSWFKQNSQNLFYCNKSFIYLQIPYFATTHLNDKNFSNFKFFSK